MESRLALISFFESGETPVYPNQGLPSGPNRPDNSLPSDGHIWLPVYPFDPTVPSNELPSGGHPSTGPIVPGRKFIVKWVACVGLALVPDNELPAHAQPK